MTISSDFLPMLVEFFNDDPATGTYHQYTSTYNPATSENEETQVDTTVKIILLDLTNSSNGLSTKFGTLIEAGDKEVWLMPAQVADPLATPIIPKPSSDKLTIAGITYKVAAVKEGNHTGANVLIYNMMLKH